METVTDFIFLGTKITANGDCSHEIKRGLLLGRKAITNLDSILKTRDISLPTKIHPVKAIVFPVVRMGWLDGITDLMDMSLSKFQEIVKDREVWHAIVHGVAKSRM